MQLDSGTSSNLIPVAGAQTSSSSTLPHTSNRTIPAESFLSRTGSSSASGSSAASSSGSSSGASSLFVAGSFLPQSGQTSPATSRSNSTHDPLESADHPTKLPLLLKPSFKAQGKRKLSDLLTDHLVASPDAITKTFAGLNKDHDDDDGSLPVVSEPIDEPIFPVTLYNSAYRFFPSRNPSPSARPYPHSHPPSEAQCPWAIQEAAWGKEAKRCGRAFASPELLARHVLLTHCQIGPAPERQPQPRAASSSNLAPLSQAKASSATPVLPIALPSSSAPTASATTSRSSASVTKVPCRYGTCNNRSFTSTAKMRAHVLQVHILPAFLYNCPFENCRLTASEQPDTQHKLDGHIDRIHDEEDEQLRPFTRSGGIGPKGARFSLLKKIPASILDKDKGGVQPGAAWAYMQRAASVSGIDLDVALLSELVVPPSGVGGTGFEPAVDALLGRGRAGEDALSAILIDDGPSTSSVQYYADTSLNELEIETALKLNAIEKVGRISSEDVDGFWLHQPLALRPPLPRPRGKGHGKGGNTKSGARASNKGSPSKQSVSAAYSHLNFKAIYAALDEEIALRRARSLAASLRPRVSSAHRALIKAPTHPASSQNLPMLPSRVQPYVSLLARMSYWEQPAIPQLPSETMLALSLPVTSSNKAGEILARRHAKARARILEEHRADRDGTIMTASSSSSSGLPKRQPFLDVYIDRPERTMPVEGVEFKKAGEGAFLCVEIPFSGEHVSRLIQQQVGVGSDPAEEGPIRPPTEPVMEEMKQPSTDHRVEGATLLPDDPVLEGTTPLPSNPIVEKTTQPLGGPLEEGTTEPACCDPETVGIAGPVIVVIDADSGAGSDLEDPADLPPSLTASGFLERLEIPSRASAGSGSGHKTPGASSNESAIGNLTLAQRDAAEPVASEEDRVSVEAEPVEPDGHDPLPTTDDDIEVEDISRKRRASQSSNLDIDLDLARRTPWALFVGQTADV
ncbi:hypothetical protein OC845_005479 [Tilletia horrida]|nr:hypothetical protein OC845_005479 [Tilletia horrida]